MNSKRKLIMLTMVGLAAIFTVSFLKTRFSLRIVSGDSMLPTLRTGDLLLVDRKAYRHGNPDRGDLIITSVLRCCIVKRIVGLPGERLELQQGVLYLNGSAVVENYPNKKGLLAIQPGTLLPGKFATLGDNRDMVDVLAVHPIVTKDQILGKVIFIVRL